MSKNSSHFYSLFMSTLTSLFSTGKLNVDLHSFMLFIPTYFFLGDSESSDSGLDSMSTSTGNSFPSDYMDLDEFLSAQSQNGQENQAVPRSCENAQNRPSTNPIRAVDSSKEAPSSVSTDTTLSKSAAEVNTVLTSLMLSKVTSLPMKVDTTVFQAIQATASQPAANNAIIQWCKSVGVARQDHNEAMGPSPGKTPVRRRRNAKYVYNPLPISKKAERRFVTQGDKDERYWERRIKNNVAAKRSRDMRRQKEIEVSEKFKQLERENALLKEEVQRLRIKAVELEQKLARFQGSNM